MELIFTILSLIGFSFLLVESTLSKRIKKFFFLNEDNHIISALSNYSFYKKNVKYHILLIPIWGFFKAMRFASEALGCVACTSVWLSLFFCLITGTNLMLIGIVYLLTLCFMKFV